MNSSHSHSRESLIFGWSLQKPGPSSQSMRKCPNSNSTAASVFGNVFLTFLAPIKSPVTFRPLHSVLTTIPRPHSAWASGVNLVGRGHPFHCRRLPSHRWLALLVQMLIPIGHNVKRDAARLRLRAMATQIEVSGSNQLPGCLGRIAGDQRPRASRNFSASSAAMHPDPAAVIAWR